MIEIPFPHMVLNSHNVPPPDYKMWNSWKVASSHSAGGMISWIAQVARGAPGGSLAGLVFNSHGRPGGLSLGSGLNRSNVQVFTGLSGLVDEIYIVACQVGQVGTGGGDPFDGNLFCYDMALYSGATVYVSNIFQDTGIAGFFDAIGYGCIDDYEGMVLQYIPGKWPNDVTGNL